MLVCYKRAVAFIVIGEFPQHMQHALLLEAQNEHVMLAAHAALAYKNNKKLIKKAEGSAEGDIYYIILLRN